MMVACNQKADVVVMPSSQQEIGLAAFTKNATKAYGDGSYVEANLFAGTLYNGLHTPDHSLSLTAANARTMWISAYLEPQTGIAGNYFKEYTYKYAAGSPDNLWHNFVDVTEGGVVTPTLTPIYWPLGGSLSFLALSATNANFAADLEFDDLNVANKAVLVPGSTLGDELKPSADPSAVVLCNDYKQDDILFASTPSRKVGTQPTVDMTFKHAQAWIQFRLNATKDDVISIKKIEILDAYDYVNSVLTVENNNGDARAEWDFRKAVRKDIVMDDVCEICGDGKFLEVFKSDEENYGYMDMLIPEQPKTSFLVTYTLEGQPNVLQFKYDLARENWLMGYKYVYSINFGVNEITIDPSVETFAGGDVSDLIPADPDVIL